LAISCFGVGLQGGAKRQVHQIAVGHIKIDALFDTGAESSLISSDVYDSLSHPKQPRLSNCPLGLTTADGGHMSIRGHVVPFLLGSGKCWRPVIVVHGLHLPCIIGIDTMAAKNISIDPVNQKINLGTKIPTEGTNINVSCDYIICIENLTAGVNER
jgi:predicted aspartyl protease